MNRVWIAQCLCPQRHCIFAGAAEAGHKRAAEKAALQPLKIHIAERLADGTLNPWCGICYAPAEKWRYEVGRTAWATLAEAMPAMRAVETANIAAGIGVGEFLGSSRNRGRA